jgi:glucose/arabinose dehydrogenase
MISAAAEGGWSNDMSAATRLSAVFVILLAGAPEAMAQSVEVRTGEAAFGGWSDDAPGVRRLIRPQDLPEPGATRPSSNRAGRVAPSADARPQVPQGFTAELVADGFRQPRVIRTAPNGDLFVAESRADRIRVLRIPEGSARPEANEVFASDLDRPYGIAFYPPGPNPEWVYVANQGSVVRFPYKEGDLTASGEPETVVSDLPTGGHWTRDLAFSQDGSRMFVSVGSASNIGEGMSRPPEGFAESHTLGAAWGEEERRAAVLSFDPNGGDEKTFATGLRNCSGLTVQPEGGALWCAVNERDQLGDDLPFEFATSVAEGAFYGWPWYYIGGKPDPRHRGARADLAGEVTVPDVLMQAHSAPLAIAFYEGTLFPEDYRGDAFVTMHGSWNRGQRTGYKVVRLLFDNGKPTGEYEDFMTGFVVSDEEVWGRPVGVTVGGDGALFVTEDGSGTIWRVAPERGPS